MELESYRVPSAGRIHGTVRVPPSKSITQRYLNLALLAAKPVVLECPLLAEDTRGFLAALESLGWQIDKQPDQLLLRPGQAPEHADIDCGPNGTMLRFLVASLSTLAGRWRLDGSARLRTRPVDPLVTALRELGASISYLEQEGFAPLLIEGRALEGGEVSLDAGQSSQFLSALLMAAGRARQPVNIRVSSLTSGPYVELTLETLKESGVEIERPGEALFRVLPGEIEAGHRRVEGDFSSAAYPAAAALLTQGRVELVGLRKASLQGDRRFLEVLAEMGARVEWEGETVVVGGTGSLTAVDRDLSSMPDQVPTLAAVAPFARGTTRIRNVAHLRLKESDRIAAMARELGRLGVEVEEFEDGLAVAGNWADSQPPSDEVVVDSHGDHRVAMSLALTGLRRPGVIVQDPGVVGKSYSVFWKDLERLLEL